MSQLDSISQNLLWNTSRGSLTFTDTKVMGIVNCTPDSFFSGSRVQIVDEAIQKASEMIAQGADILDIGGYSTRSGAAEVPVTEEMERVLPVISALRNTFPHIWISIDTFRQQVAEAAIANGADMVNDIAAGSLDARMLPWIEESKLPYIFMHMQGTPATMQQNPQYQHVVHEVFVYLQAILQQLQKAGCIHLMIDPGFGFGKSVGHNYSLLKHLDTFCELQVPVLVGVSRKSMVTRLLNIPAQEALNGTTALHMLALARGAHVLRVHDVLEAVQCVKIFKELQKAP